MVSEHNVTLLDLINHGILQANAHVRYNYRGIQHAGVVNAIGEIHTTEGTVYINPTHWTRTVSGNNCSGWGTVRLSDGNIPLLKLKRDYLLKVNGGLKPIKTKLKASLGDSADTTTSADNSDDSSHESSDSSSSTNNNNNNNNNTKKPVKIKRKKHQQQNGDSIVIIQTFPSQLNNNPATIINSNTIPPTAADAAAAAAIVPNDSSTTTTAPTQQQPQQQQQQQQQTTFIGQQQSNLIPLPLSIGFNTSPFDGEDVSSSSQVQSIQPPIPSLPFQTSSASSVDPLPSSTSPSGQSGGSVGNTTTNSNSNQPTNFSTKHKGRFGGLYHNSPIPFRPHLQAHLIETGVPSHFSPNVEHHNMDFNPHFPIDSSNVTQIPLTPVLLTPSLQIPFVYPSPLYNLPNITPQKNNNKDDKTMKRKAIQSNTVACVEQRELKKIKMEPLESKQQQTPAISTPDQVSSATIGGRSQQLKQTCKADKEHVNNSNLVIS
ncbi:hypothetical protein SAMD00019534_125030 [Acytostelium subglobosum LB1]|uniref:hypothetical protein n=1 Tax=Acytostelium subglobosum LB1 TaxID=1410327 RepID=UPI000644FDAD|nr:hypothetical protein SAMD00019534_125030 [Acytostelium subglobosum LB1]GAM29327.1 hypothetical protein SAMD00019534_125030 [Acytostelium subglobosum LB1]|eukprot:XP_012747754.1 hypothetical protein SAMD00019534_125030 [Acytostelium subglobosum LB1]